MALQHASILMTLAGCPSLRHVDGYVKNNPWQGSTKVQPSVLD